MNKVKNELKDMNAQQLIERIVTWRHELFGLRLNRATAHIKDYSQFKKIRRNIACALTFLRHKVNEN